MGLFENNKELKCGTCIQMVNQAQIKEENTLLLHLGGVALNRESIRGNWKFEV